MSETKFTPGPYSTPVDYDFDTRPICVVQPEAIPANGGMQLAQFFGPDRVANATLYAAGPDLYAALDNLLRTHNGEGGTKYHAGEIAAAALAKARGEA